MIEPLLPADVDIEDRQGTACLVSRRFGDIYFAIADGLAETRLVFIEGNKLAERMPGRHHFTIAETGFGTGLNFLATLALLEDMGHAAPRLTYIATELAPLDGEMMRKALAGFPELAPYREMLISHLPPRWPGRHRVLLNGGKVVLELLYGDSATMIKRTNFQADAWFLDGFAPARNPDMWGDDLFTLIASHTAEKGTLASFTSAGHVRRGLEAAGFSVHRLEGYGNKRHRITAEFNGKSTSLPSQSGHVAIIGAGIAGASVAAGLNRRGYNVTVLGSGADAADGASGNRIAVQAPRLTATDTSQARLSLTGYGYARRLARETGASVADKTILYAWNEREQIRQEKITALGWPETVFRLVDTNTAKAITGHETHLGGMLFPEGGTVIPHQLVRCCLDGVTLRLGVSVRSVTKQLSGWRIDTDAGPVACDIAVLAMGAGLPLVSC
ncbi:MAG: FAD-dependent oxidoreductase, partial [Alphaproteobacteria bacterium]|nr:FAD-dependent oxidoreductase [Alphaproteobacteria bacterium]